MNACRTQAEVVSDGVSESPIIFSSTFSRLPQFFFGVSRATLVKRSWTWIDIDTLTAGLTSLPFPRIRTKTGMHIKLLVD